MAGVDGHARRKIRHLELQVEVLEEKLEAILVLLEAIKEALS